MSLLQFLNAVRMHWWPLMSCAAFTLLGSVVLYFNENNAWALRATFGLALCCLFWACFLAWRDKDKEVSSLQSKLGEAERTGIIPAPIQNIYLPAHPVRTLPEPLRHNVHCLGVEIVDMCVVIRFQNIPIPNKPLGNFNNAHVCVEFWDGLTGTECATILAARWIEDGGGNNAVGIIPRRAFLAVFRENDPISKWRALPDVEGSLDLTYHERIDGVWLPSSRLKVKATLAGENNLTLPPVIGWLTLSDTGQAVWESID